MAEVRIYGCSDDLIELVGDITDEFNPRSDDGDLLVFSEGTVLRIVYNSQGIWRITPVVRGTASYTKDENPENDDHRYSDIVTLNGDITWVVYGDRFIR